MEFGVAEGAHFAFDVGDVFAAGFDEEAAAVEVGLGGGFHRMKGGGAGDGAGRAKLDVSPLLTRGLVHRSPADARFWAQNIRAEVDNSGDKGSLKYQIARVAGFAKDAWKMRWENKKGKLPSDFRIG